MLLDGKTALVTGGAQGIGQGCALELAKAGADIILNDRTISEELLSTVKMIRSLGRECHSIDADVFSRASCEQLCQRALQLAGRIDILVSNPAFSRRCAFLDMSPEMFDQIIHGTLTSGFHMSQLVARQMVEQKRGGKILFISSVQAEMPFMQCSAYGAAKAALNQLTRSIALELSEHRINVNAIEPGRIDTPGEHVAFSEEVLQAAAEALPWGRLGLPQDIGRAAVFLCSEYADYITGTVLPVDGAFRFKDLRVE